MKRIFNLLFLVLALLLGFSTCQKRNVPLPQEELLYDLECFFQQQPDSVLQIIDTLNVAALSEKERAHYCLLKARAIGQTDRNNAEADSLLQVAADYFSKHDEKYFEALTYRTQFRVAGVGLGLSTENERQTFDLGLKALECFEQCQHLDLRLLRCAKEGTDEQLMIDIGKNDLRTKLGIAYSTVGFTEESIHYLTLADRFYAKQGYNKARIRTSFPLGTNYLELEEYDSCLMYFENGLRCAEAVHDDVERSYYYVAMNLYYMSLYDFQKYETEEERLQLLRKAVASSRKGLEILDSITEPNYSLGAEAFRQQLNQSLCSGYFELQQYDSSLYFGKQNLGMNEGDLVLDETYQYMLRSYIAMGDMENAKIYANLYFATIWDFEFVGKEVAEVNDEYKNRLEMQRFEDEQQLKRMRLYLCIAGLIIILLVVSFLFYRHQKEKQLETLRLAEEKQQLQQNYADRERISEEALRQRIQTVYLEQNDKLYDRILKEFNALYPNILKEIKLAYPELTDTEVSICLLSFFSFRVKEIAYILDLKENTVSKSRLNIKRKTGIEELADVVKPFIN